MHIHTYIYMYIYQAVSVEGPDGDLVDMAVIALCLITHFNRPLTLHRPPLPLISVLMTRQFDKWQRYVLHHIRARNGARVSDRISRARVSFNEKNDRPSLNTETASRRCMLRCVDGYGPSHYSIYYEMIIRCLSICESTLNLIW